ncbi:hypothetical protein [Streptomyces sp. NPDC002588]|uniref:hypothetical protein n=1 Tax=Streptomyces sp. NPDC002588 TaxID=3154419 RepID=UPI00331AC7B4
MSGREEPRWLAPAPLWSDGTVGTGSDLALSPWITELENESFFDEFLAILGGTGGRSPADLAGTGPKLSGEDGSFRLFTPTSHFYNLVTASLVCHRPGIPDHTPRPRLGERAFFVIRLIGDGAESAFVPGPPGAGSWVPATAGVLTPGERELPLHPVPVASFAPSGTAAATLGMAAGRPSTRTVLYGYIPVPFRDADSGDGPAHVIHAVLARDPCPPVFSAPSHPFRLAGQYPPVIPTVRTGPRPADPPDPPEGPTP